MLEGREEESEDQRQGNLSRSRQWKIPRLLRGAAVEHQVVHGGLPLGEPELTLGENTRKRFIAQDKMSFGRGEEGFGGMVEGHENIALGAAGE
jgi:hypothetical protein